MHGVNVRRHDGRNARWMTRMNGGDLASGAGEATAGSDEGGEPSDARRPVPSNRTCGARRAASDLKRRRAVGDTEKMVRKSAGQDRAQSPPVCQAMLLCDSVIREEGTQKITLVGVFDTFWLAKFPGRTSRCGVFLRLIDGTGEFSITAEVQDPERGVVVSRAPWRRKAQDFREGVGSRLVPANRSLDVRPSGLF